MTLIGKSKIFTTQGAETLRKAKNLPRIDADKRGSGEIARIAGIAKIAEIETQNLKPKTYH